MAKIAIIIDKMFEDTEFKEPYDRLRAAGHDVDVIGIESGKELEGKKGKETFTPTHAAKDVGADNYDALVIPGGFSPDYLRTDLDMVRLTRDMFNANKPVAAICHGGWMLVEADAVDGRTVTSWPAIKTDLINAGARWVDREVVEDGNVITSRKPGDVPAFCAALLRQIEEGVPERMEPPLAPEATSEQRPEMS